MALRDAPSVGMFDGRWEWTDLFWNFFSVAMFVLATWKALEIVFWFVRHVSWVS